MICGINMDSYGWLFNMFFHFILMFNGFYTGKLCGILPWTTRISYPLLPRWYLLNPSIGLLTIQLTYHKSSTNPSLFAIMISKLDRKCKANSNTYPNPFCKSWIWDIFGNCIAIVFHIWQSNPNKLSHFCDGNMSGGTWMRFSLFVGRVGRGEVRWRKYWVWRMGIELGN